MYSFKSLEKKSIITLYKKSKTFYISHTIIFLYSLKEEILAHFIQNQKKFLIFSKRFLIFTLR